MKTLMVSYDLKTPGQKYDPIYEYLKGFDGWAHALDSLWFVRTDKSPSEVRDELGAIIDANDHVLVLDVTGDDWASRLTTPLNDWLQNHMHTLDPIFG